MKQLFCIISLLLFFACSSSKKIIPNQLADEDTFLITEISDDKSYGLSSKNLVEVGGALQSSGPKNERRYLNALAGPNGENVTYHRAGSCCGVKSKNGFMGVAMLDNHRVTWEGSTDTVSIYINMYDTGKLKAPMGFTIKSRGSRM